MILGETVNVTNLGGHSGCHIMLHGLSDGTTFVRKTSKDAEYNDRLRSQMEKQGAFQDHLIKAPIIYQSGVDENGLFYFDMEYIQGVTLAKYMTSIEISKIRQIVEVLLDNKNEISIRKNKDVYEISKKIESLSKTITDDAFLAAMEMLRMHDWSGLPVSDCHGDLSLENIIIKGDQIFEIDFLDSFFDSWIIDIGALLQDVQALWAYRNMEYVDINARIRLIVFRDILLEKLKEIAPEYVQESYYVLLMKLLRIVPYADDKTVEFLGIKTKEIVNIIREGRFYENTNRSMCR